MCVAAPVTKCAQIALTVSVFSQWKDLGDDRQRRPPKGHTLLDEMKGFVRWLLFSSIRRSN